MLPEPGDEAPEGQKEVREYDSWDLVHRRAVKDAQMDDVVCIVTVHEDSRVRTTSSVATEEQRDWLCRQLKTAIEDTEACPNPDR